MKKITIVSRKWFWWVMMISLILPVICAWVFTRNVPSILDFHAPVADEFANRYTTPATHGKLIQFASLGSISGDHCSGVFRPESLADGLKYYMDSGFNGQFHGREFANLLGWYMLSQNGKPDNDILIHALDYADKARIPYLAYQMFDLLDHTGRLDAIDSKTLTTLDAALKKLSFTRDPSSSDVHGVPLVAFAKRTVNGMKPEGTQPTKAQLLEVVHENEFALPVWTISPCYSLNVRQGIQGLWTMGSDWRTHSGSDFDPVPSYDSTYTVQQILSLFGWKEMMPEGYNFWYFSQIFRRFESSRTIFLLGSAIIQYQRSTGQDPASIKKLAADCKIELPEQEPALSPDYFIHILKNPKEIAEKAGKPVGEITWTKVPVTDELTCRYLGLNYTLSSSHDKPEPGVPVTSSTVKISLPYGLPSQSVSKSKLMLHSLELDHPGMITGHFQVLSDSTADRITSTGIMVPSLAQLDRQLLTAEAQRISKQNPSGTAGPVSLQVIMPREVWTLNWKRSSREKAVVQQVFLPVEFRAKMMKETGNSSGEKQSGGSK